MSRRNSIRSGRKRIFLRGGGSKFSSREIFAGRRLQTLLQETILRDHNLENLMKIAFSGTDK